MVYITLNILVFIMGNILSTPSFKSYMAIIFVLKPFIVSMSIDDTVVGAFID